MTWIVIYSVFGLLWAEFARMSLYNSPELLPQVDLNAFYLGQFVFWPLFFAIFVISIFVDLE